MQPYYKYSKAELVSFGTGRQLTVRSTAKTSAGPTKADYIKALKCADGNFRFRFLDLPPKVRTIVYKKLLTLQDSFTCHPQILRTCNSINEEASSVLYEENLIDIRIDVSGVCVHGERCGNYVHEPRFYTTCEPPFAPPGVLKWPQFIRKAQHIRISKSNEHTSRTMPGVMTPQAQLGSLYFIIHSLCTFLYQGNNLQSLVVVPPEDAFPTPQAVARYIESARTVLYPLKLLSSIKRLRVLGMYSKDQKSMFVTPENVAAQIDPVQSGLHLPLVASLDAARAAIMSRARSNGPTAQPWLQSEVPETPSFSGICYGEGTVDSFFAAMDALRTAWSMSSGEEAVQSSHGIGELVRLEIELKLRMGREGCS